jgi:hypothetical protein
MDEMSLISRFIGDMEELKAKNATAEATVDYLRKQGLRTVQVTPERDYGLGVSVVSYAAEGLLLDSERRAVVEYPDETKCTTDKDDSATIRLELRLVQSEVAAHATVDYIESPRGNRMAVYALLRGGTDAVPYQAMWKLPMFSGLAAIPYSERLLRPTQNRAVSGSTFDR